MPGVAAGGQVAVDGGRAQFQSIAQVHRRRQGVAATVGGYQAVATAGQQAGEAFRHAVVALQPLALCALEQRRVERQRYPGAGGKARQHVGQWPGSQVVGARGGIGGHRCGGQGGHGDGEAQGLQRQAVRLAGRHARVPWVQKMKVLHSSPDDAGKGITGMFTAAVGAR
ncbi:hypothetical protein D3C81_1798540 [compost metagenome]